MKYSPSSVDFRNNLNYGRRFRRLTLEAALTFLTSPVLYPRSLLKPNNLILPFVLLQT
jgi:hypothetical protein